MPSSYTLFSTNYTIRPGYTFPYPEGTEVKVFACDAPAADINAGLDPGLDGADVATLEVNADGDVMGGTLPVDAGTLVRFRIDNWNGISWCKSEVTT